MALLYKRDKALLVGSSTLGNERTELVEKIKSKEYYTVAADAGIMCFTSCKKRPDYWLGDMDTCKGIHSIDINEADEILPVVKDETDMAVAIRHVYKLGFREIEIYGGLAGMRQSHSIANIQLLHQYSKLGCKITLVGEECEMLAITNDSIRFDGTKQGSISIFSLNTVAKNVKIKGFRYPFEGDLSNEIPLGVSNSFLGVNSEVSVEDGTLLIIIENA